MRDLAWLELVGLLAVQAVVIAVLLLERRNRRRAERALQDRIAFETLLSNVLWEFAHGEPAQLPDTVAQALRHVAGYVHADRVSLVHFADRNLSRSVQRAGGNGNGNGDGGLVSVATHPVAEFPATVKTLAQGQAVTFSSLANLPPALESDRDAFVRLGVEALLALPISSDGGVVGTLVVGTIGSRREWSDGLIQRLRALADVFSGVLVRQHALRAAQRSAAVSTAVLGATPNPVVYIDHVGVIRQVNEAWMRGAMERGAQSLSAVSAGASYVEECRRAIARGDASAAVALEGIEEVLTGRQEHFSLQYPSAGPDGERWYEMWVEALRGPDAGAVISHLDVTEQHGARAELRRHQQEVVHLSRTGTMGKFAASLAHELSQPLAAILANSQAARRFLAGGRKHLSEVRAILEDIDADDQRAGEMIRRMRALFGRHEVEMTTVDLNEVVRDAIALVRSDAVLRRVTVVLDLAEGLGPVRADRIQLQQVLLNLILNALEAMADQEAPGGGRRLMLRTNRGADGYAEVSVRDTGCGIPPEVMDRLFEAYFTTKRDGMGMGLSIAHSIARGHGGRVWATNNSDCGATFHLALPLVSGTSS